MVISFELFASPQLNSNLHARFPEPGILHSISHFPRLSIPFTTPDVWHMKRQLVAAAESASGLFRRNSRRNGASTADTV